MTEEILLKIVVGLSSAVLGLAGYVAHLHRQNAKQSRTYAESLADLGDKYAKSLEKLQENRITDMKEFQKGSVAMVTRCTETIQATNTMLEQIREIMSSVWRRMSGTSTNPPR